MYWSVKQQPFSALEFTAFELLSQCGYTTFLQCSCRTKKEKSHHVLENNLSGFVGHASKFVVRALYTRPRGNGTQILSRADDWCQTEK